MKRAHVMPVAAIVLAALSACPSPSDTRPPWPSPAPTIAPGPTAVPTAPPARPSRTPQGDETSPARTTTPTPRRAATAAPTTGEADPTEPVTGAGYDTCAELTHDYPGGVADTHPAYDPKFDPDRDGWACEPT